MKDGCRVGITAAYQLLLRRLTLLQQNGQQDALIRGYSEGGEGLIAASPQMGICGPKVHR